MTTIKLTLTGARAQAEVDGVLTAGMVGVPVEIVYDDAWEGLNKTLVCKSCVGTQSILNIANSATLAPGVLRRKEQEHNILFLGVEGRREDGTLVIPSTMASCGEIKPGAEPTDDAQITPESTAWTNILSLIGDLNTLETAQKDSLVAALNDLLHSCGNALTLAVKELEEKIDAHTEKTDTALDALAVSTDEKIAACQTKLDRVSADGAGAHNAVYRGKSLGSFVTEAQYAAIADGSFADLYIGDYWSIDGVNYRIASFDYYMNTGDEWCTKHHVTLVPEKVLYQHAMNTTQTVSGGYVGSKMYTEGLAQAKTTIEAAFGAEHILVHRQFLSTQTLNGYISDGDWLDSSIELMDEQNVYGGKFLNSILFDFELGYKPQIYTVDKSQYPLFAFRPDLISTDARYWLRDVASRYDWCMVSNGRATSMTADTSAGVRPAFSICA